MTQQSVPFDYLRRIDFDRSILYLSRVDGVFLQVLIEPFRCNLEMLSLGVQGGCTQEIAEHSAHRHVPSGEYTHSDQVRDFLKGKCKPALQCASDHFPNFLQVHVRSNDATQQELGHQAVCHYVFPAHFYPLLYS